MNQNIIKILFVDVEFVCLLLLGAEDYSEFDSFCTSPDQTTTLANRIRLVNKLVSLI